MLKFTRRKKSMTDEEFAAWFQDQLVPDGDCLLWPWGRANGYGMVGHYHGKNRLTHRVAFFLEHGRWPFPQCNHHCDVPKCCNPEHLYEGTKQDNVDDRMRRGRHKPMIGSKHPNAILNETKVKSIRAMAKAGIPHQRIADLIGVATATARNVIYRRAWKHI